jgi:large subunit ribosomal protein L16
MSAAGAKRRINGAMLSPKRSKHRKAHKGRVHGLAKGGTTLNFGAFGLKASDPGRITARQIEAARRAITRHIRRAGRVWIRVFPDVPVSQKPAEVRMGSGKGSPEFWVCRIKPGRIMFELDGVSVTIAREAFALAAAKLPVGTRFIVRQGEEIL